MENNLEEDINVNINKVKFNRVWSFWENYDTKPDVEKPDYSQLVKEIFSLPTIIDFWQFWNIYPGAIPANIFYDGKATK